MAQRATKDTFATEIVGGAEVRRRIKAGSLVPDHWDVEGGTEDAGENAKLGEGFESTSGPDELRQAIAETATADRTRTDAEKEYVKQQAEQRAKSEQAEREAHQQRQAEGEKAEDGGSKASKQK